MSELNIPDSWTMTKLENLVEILDYKRRPITAKNRIEGPYPYYGANGIRGYHNDYLFDDRLLLLAEDGGHFGSKTKDIAYIIEGKSWVNNHAHVLKSVEGVSLDYLFQYLRMFNVKPWVTGATVPKLNQAKTKSLPIALPPFEEQKRIVKKIESCFEKVNLTEQNLIKAEELLSKYRESLLAKIFRGELIAQDSHDELASKLLEEVRIEREKNQTDKKKKQEFKAIPEDEKPFDIPESWEWIPLGEIIEGMPKNGYSPPTSNSPTDIKTLKLSATTTGIFCPEYFKYVKEKIPKDSKYWLKKGDILIQRSNSLKYLGATAIYDGKDNEFIYPDLMMRIKPSKVIIKDYLVMCLQLKQTQLYFQKSASGAASNMPKINQRIVVNTPIPLPPIRIQEEIVSYLSRIKLKISEMNNCNSALSKSISKTKESILKKAFEGELVEQIESEGTGEALLNKILEKK